MTDLSSSGDDAGLPQGNLLNARVRRDIADLNRLFLERALHPTHGLDPWFRLPAPAVDRLRAASPDALERAARCPFALFELALPPCDEPETWAVDAVADDPEGGLLEQTQREARRAFGVAALGLVRALTEGAPLAPRLTFGLRAGTEARLAAFSLADSYRVAIWHGLIRPRWHLHERYWNLLAELVPSEEGVRWAYAAGVCLLVQCDRRASVAKSPAHRLPRRLSPVAPAAPGRASRRRHRRGPDDESDAP